MFFWLRRTWRRFIFKRAYLQVQEVADYYRVEGDPELSKALDHYADFLKACWSAHGRG